MEGASRLDGRGVRSRVWTTLAILCMACQPVATKSQAPPPVDPVPDAEVNRDLAAGSNRSRVADVDTVERLRVEVIASFPHDESAFTQGLVWDGGILYESTGLYGRSSVRQIEPASGRVMLRRLIDPALFAEGLALVGDRLVVLTWKAGVALTLELGGLEIIDQYSYRGEGWGLAYDGEHLVMSDGSARLFFRDPADFRLLRTVDVTMNGEPVDKLNELEVVDGRVYANVWLKDYLVRIDPREGRVEALIDASGLLTTEERRRVDVLNGLAYDPVGKTFWITGKLWPKIFQVRFVPS